MQSPGADRAQRVVHPGGHRRIALVGFLALEYAVFVAAPLVLVLVVPGTDEEPASPWLATPFVAGLVVGALLGLRTRIAIDQRVVIVQNPIRAHRILLADLQQIRATRWIGQMDAVELVGSTSNVRSLAVGSPDLPELDGSLRTIGWGPG
jgi:hypothetical protein